jgi:hypothetical protein
VDRRKSRIAAGISFLCYIFRARSINAVPDDEELNPREVISGPEDRQAKHLESAGHCNQISRHVPGISKEDHPYETF